VTGRLAREEGGFGLVELILALVVLNIVILALFGIFNAGQLALARASRQLTAETVADRQMELFRARLYDDIGLDNTLLTSTATTNDTTHTSDSAWGSQFAATSCTTALPECQPIRTVDKTSSPASPDSKSYRVDTYVRVLQPGDPGFPPSGRPVKRVTVVVRKGANLATRPLARLTSTFDKATGCTTAC
jgi:type II secretory pathway pseudopilin PulG